MTQDKENVDTLTPLPEEEMSLEEFEKILLIETLMKEQEISGVPSK